MSRPSPAGQQLLRASQAPRSGPCVELDLRVRLSRTPVGVAETCASIRSARSAETDPSPERSSTTVGRLCTRDLGSQGCRAVELIAEQPRKRCKLRHICPQMPATALSGPPDSGIPSQCAKAAASPIDSGSTTIRSPNAARSSSAIRSPRTARTPPGAAAPLPPCRSARGPSELSRRASHPRRNERARAGGGDHPPMPIRKRSAPVHGQCKRRAVRAPSSRSSQDAGRLARLELELQVQGGPASSIANTMLPASPSVRCRSSATCALSPASWALPSTVATRLSPNTGGASASRPIESRSRTTPTGRCGTLR